jgi:hypothetical protein
MVAHLVTASKSNRMLNGAVIKASLTLLPAGRPDKFGNPNMHAAVAGTAKLRNGTICQVAGDAFSDNFRVRLVRWGGFELGIRCPDGSGQAIGIFDDRILLPYGNGGEVPADELCKRLD